MDVEIYVNYCTYNNVLLLLSGNPFCYMHRGHDCINFGQYTSDTFKILFYVNYFLYE